DDPRAPDPRRVRRQDHQHSSVAAARVQGRARGRGRVRRRRQGHRLHGARRDARPRQRTDPRPGGGSGPSRRHGRDPARAGEGGRAPPLPAGPPRAGRGRVVRRALLSVYDKTGLVDFARGLVDLGFELVSSGKTASALAEAGAPGTTVEDVTGAPEMLDGRVKTLHPRIHGGLLADLGKESHRADLEAQGITPIELVVSNLYPFLERPDIETIDIGGPAMVRAAAKNHAWVGVVTSPDQYDGVLEELRAGGGALSDATRRRLALEAFAHTAAYDAAIVRWLQHGEKLPRHLVLALERTPDELRYGENPRQQAARYRRAGSTSWGDAVQQHSGPALSYLNYYDTHAAWQLAHDLGEQPACAIIKHATPCGAAVATDAATAYQRALESDELSAFGGIVALNEPVDAATAERMVAGPQADVIVAPAYAPGTLDALIKKRTNTRLLPD